MNRKQWRIMANSSKDAKDSPEHCCTFPNCNQISKTKKNLYQCYTEIHAVVRWSSGSKYNKGKGMENLIKLNI